MAIKFFCDKCDVEMEGEEYHTLDIRTSSPDGPTQDEDSIGGHEKCMQEVSEYIGDSLQEIRDNKN